MQINGAELEALEGLRRRINSVRVLRIASYYTRDGRSNCDLCCELLGRLGCTVLSRSRAGGILACPDRYVRDNAQFRKPL